jgi:CRISPR-associated protein Csb1
MGTIDAGRLADACSDDGFDAGIRIVTELEPVAGPGAPVKPPIYAGMEYQHDKRWESTDADAPTDVIVLDNVPSQANRLEDAVRRAAPAVGVPEIVLDLSSVGELPPHLPRRISSWQFPHRNADAYLRDAELDGVDFLKTDIGRAIFDATAWNAGSLMAWTPQGLLFGFWQSHLGKKRSNAKHARAWVSEIIGWSPAASETRTQGLKGDPLNLNSDDPMTFNPNDQVDWEIGKTKLAGGETKKLSEIGHGQVLVGGSDAARAAVSFARITQTATVSFAQLRRVSLGGDADPAADAAARALLVALGLFAHVRAFGRAFELRSVADLRPSLPAAMWLGAAVDDAVELPDSDAAAGLLAACVEQARKAGVPLDGWGREPLLLTPKPNLAAAIRSTWPLN